MNVFETHAKVKQEYAAYIRSFINIADPDISRRVEAELSSGRLWPEPLLQFNPGFEKAGTVAQLVAEGKFHPDFSKIFTDYSLYTHQVEALNLGMQGRDFVVTSGTGSGKSLTYMATIFQHVLSNPGITGIQAVIVYPMNALINSQTNELNTYAENYRDATGREFPITFGQYTGQEDEEKRSAMRDSPPHILLTNYMMLELLLTRIRERSIRDSIYQNLRFLVFDELHTFRGRQGADIAMLIRRIRAKCQKELVCIGTSATMVSENPRVPETVEEQVAKVANQLFGRPFSAQQVVIEKLARSLAVEPSSLSKERLAAEIRKGIDFTADAEALKTSAVASWLEAAVALDQVNDRLIRAKPRTQSEIVRKLADASGESSERCTVALVAVLRWISEVNREFQRSNPRSRYTILPHRLHQFFSQTGSVYTTLDQDEGRFITLEPGLYKPDEQEQKPIFPSVFSRYSGHQFICVSRNGEKLEPREFRESGEDDDGRPVDGYLVVGADVWDPVADLENLPESWFKQRKSGPVIDPNKQRFLPERIYFDEFGNCSDSTPLRWAGWFMRAPLLFDPTSGTFFDTRTSESTKLAKVGSEGRSTSTTITTFSILNQLDKAGYNPKDQKLLSFTDNRQDAALQSGHFNDFVQTVKLRGAIFNALRFAPKNELTFATLGEAVVRALNLNICEFANVEQEPALEHVRRSFVETFELFVLYRALADLRRSWRIVLPNLEQCGLLSVGYAHLPTVARDAAFWSDTPIMGDLSPEAREQVLSDLLDFFRHEYALHSVNFLSQSQIKINEKQIREKLREPWTLDTDERLDEPYSLRVETLAPRTKLFTQSVGTQSGVGKYFRLLAKKYNLQVDLGSDRYVRFMYGLLNKLEQADYLSRTVVRNAMNEDVPVYRLKIEQLIWRAGDGLTVKIDAIKQRSYRQHQPKPNEFFRELYKKDLSAMKRFRGEEHTGQLKSDVRMDREERFREGQISALFCSPTMELGIDIRDLSVVHLRNAPPSPANYAQRAGRAGRSGQGALVFTYCSSYSSHDRHYFQRQIDLVAGTVQAPRLDLCNKELMETHLNALLISEIGLPQLEQNGNSRPSLMALIDAADPSLGLSAEVRAGLRISPSTVDEVKKCFQRVVADFVPQLEERGSGWYSNDWIDHNLLSVADSLNKSLNRWRTIFKSARATLMTASQKITSGLLTPGGDEYKKYRRSQDQSNRQLALLRNETGRGPADNSEFYPYRYLAAEGFLPGYNFTRLPVRVFIPTSDSSGEFISRPRSVALREFGPHNIIYHSGRKYKVSQLITQDAESALKDAKVSLLTGYFMMDEQLSYEKCPLSGVSLNNSATTLHLSHLLEMTESRAEELERISCEEEERRHKGYEINTYFTLDGGDLSRVRRATLSTGEDTLMNLRLFPAARLIHVNRKWRSQNTEGFPMGLVSGQWSRAIPDREGAREEHRLVKLWTSTVSDALYLEPTQPLGLRYEGIVTLQSALKRSIEEIFQVESNEIGVVAVGNPDTPNILVYESAEGSLGVLAQFVNDVGVFHQVVRKAKALCRFDDSEYRAPASYDDLLSYYNQKDHSSINRFEIKDALDKLLVCSLTIIRNSNYDSYEEHYQALLRSCDQRSSTERKFLEYLYENNLRLPDEAQKRVEGIYAQPDFYYDDRVWIFCDGTPHDDPSTRARDEAQRQEIRARGDEVVVYYYRDDLGTVVRSRPDIFSKVR
jgi:superfamily II DNA or RNA helicase